MATSIREQAYEIGRTTQFTERDAMVAGALIAEDYKDQTDAVRVLLAFVQLAAVRRWSLAATAMDLLPCLRGEVITV